LLLINKTIYIAIIKPILKGNISLLYFALSIASKLQVKLTKSFIIKAILINLIYFSNITLLHFAIPLLMLSIALSVFTSRNSLLLSKYINLQIKLNNSSTFKSAYKKTFKVLIALKQSDIYIAFYII
jgi:hypothetical protein